MGLTIKGTIPRGPHQFPYDWMIWEAFGYVFGFYPNFPATHKLKKKNKTRPTSCGYAARTLLLTWVEVGGENKKPTAFCTTLGWLYLENASCRAGSSIRICQCLPQVVFDAQKSLFGFRRWVMDPHMYNNNMYLQMYTCVHDSLMKPCMKQCIKYFYKILQVTVQSFVTCFPISISRAPLLPKLCDSASDLQPPIFMFTWLGWQCLGILYHSKMCCEIRSQLQSTQKHKHSLFPVTDRVWRCLKTPPLFSDDMTIERCDTPECSSRGWWHLRANTGANTGLESQAPNADQHFLQHLLVCVQLLQNLSKTLGHHRTSLSCFAKCYPDIEQ